MDADKENIKPKRGAGRQFFGCVLLSLAILNGALAVKGGAADGNGHAFIYLLAAAGIAFLISGLAASRQ